MINPVLTVVSLIAGAVLFSSQHQTLSKLRTSNGLIQTQLAEAGQRLNLLRESQAELTAQLKRKSEEVQQQLALKNIEPVEFEQVEQRGPWPDDKEYFYLAKNLLHSMGYSPFRRYLKARYGSVLHVSEDFWKANRENPQLTGTHPRYDCLRDEPVLFYGMNQEERSSIDAAYQDAWQRFIQITCGRIERLENNFDNVEITPPSSAFYRVPANENDEVEPLEEFRAAVRNVLGEERADYFLTSAIPYLRDSLRLTRSRTDYVLWGKGVYWTGIEGGGGKEAWGLKVYDFEPNCCLRLGSTLSEDYIFSECFR